MRKELRALLTAGAVAALILVGAPAVGATPDDDYERAKSESNPVEQTPVSTDNVDLVSNLSDFDKCLFDRAVYPAGGIGYADSSLPYDDLDPTTAAVLTLRAEAIRGNPDVVLGVTANGGEAAKTVGGGAPTNVTVVMNTDAARKGQSNIDAIVQNDTQAKAAYDVLSAAGIAVQVDVRDVASTSLLCEITDKFNALTDSQGKPVTLYTAPDLEIGGLRVVATKNDEAQVRELAKQYGDYVAVEITEIADATRVIDSAPWWGGSRITGSAGYCSSSFRVNGNSLLTADHCQGGSFTNGGALVGNRYLSLAAANVDALLLAGSSYGGKIYTGSTISNSSIAANGIYPYYTLGTSNQLLISGAASGQGTLQYVGVLNGGVAENGCINTAWGTGCQLLQTTAPAGLCIGGDSGGPVGVYDPANGRVISAGIVKATMGYETQTHSCLITNMMAISYLWGGATIG